MKKTICTHTKEFYRSESGSFQSKGCSKCDVWESRDLYNGGFWHESDIDTVRRISPIKTEKL